MISISPYTISKLNNINGLHDWFVIDTGRIVCAAGSVKRSSIRPSVPSIDGTLRRSAAKAPQHGAQQQIRTVSYVDSRVDDAEHRLVTGLKKNTMC